MDKRAEVAYICVPKAELLQLDEAADGREIADSRLIEI